MGTYTAAIGTFAQQVDQGNIFDEELATGVVTASGSAVEGYTYDDSGSATVTASGSGVENYLLPPTPYDTAIDTDTPVSHWKMGSSTVLAVDRKGITDLPASGSIALASGIVLNSGDAANVFVGTVGEWFNKPPAAGLGVPYEGAYTIEAWVKPTATNSGRVVTRTPNTFLRVVDTGKGTTVAFQFRYENSAGVDVAISTLGFALDQPHHVVSVNDGSTAIIYVNGVERARATVAGILSSTTTPPSIGPETGGTGAVVDEVAWYSGALSPARVLAHYQAGIGDTVYTDSGSGTATASGGRAESFTTSDASSGFVTASGAGTEAVVYGDSRSAAVAASGSGTEDFQPPLSVYTDSGSGTVIASGTGAESYDTSDAGSGTATTSGTGAESYDTPAVYTDAGSGTVTTSGTRTESAVYGDSATIDTPGLYDATVDVDSPVSHWKLGETGQATDRKGTQNLQAVSSPPTAASLVANNGSDLANSFDGARSPAIAQRFSVPSAVGVGTPYNTSTWSAELWIKPSSFVGDPDIFFRSGTAYLWINGSSSSPVWSFGSTAFENGALKIGKLSHLVMTCDGTTGRCYVDGQLVTTAPAIPSVVNSAPIIGSRFESTATNGAFRGTIDEVSWYNTALSPARVIQHYRAGLRFEIGSTGSGSESRVYTDSGNATATTSGSGVESYSISSTYTDSGPGTGTASGSGAESAAYSDTGTATASASGSGIEVFQPPIVYTDSASATATASGSGAESFAISDASSGFASTSGTGTEAASYDDSRTAVATASGSGVEAATADDSRTATATASGSAVESFAHSASGSAAATASGTGTEAASYDDFRTATATASGSGTENFQPPVTYTDSRTATVTATGGGTEGYETAAGYEDSRTGTVAASGAVVEVFAHSATASGTVTASGTSAESATYTNSATATTTASGTHVESVTYADTASATIAASGSGVESVAYSESSTAVATATGTSIEASYADDSVTATASADGAGVESTDYADSASATAITSGSGDESYESGIVYTDTAPGTVVGSGSGTESYEVLAGYEDSGTGAFTATGEGVESVVYDDSQAAVFTASGTGAFFEGERGLAWIVTGSTYRSNTTGVAGSVGRALIVTGHVQRPGERSAAGLVVRVGPNGQGPVDRPATIETGSIEWATTSP